MTEIIKGEFWAAHLNRNVLRFVIVKGEEYVMFLDMNEYEIKDLRDCLNRVLEMIEMIKKRES